MLPTSEKHKAELERFRDLLSKAAYQTELLAASDSVPYDTLLVRIESFEEENRVWRLELSFLPGLEEELQGVSILQCFVALSDQVSEEHRSSLNELIVQRNAKLPLGNFGLLDNPGMLFFKHNAMLPNDNAAVSDKIVHELVPLTTYLISTFSEPLMRLISA
jgi:hypothetical protein